MKSWLFFMYLGLIFSCSSPKKPQSIHLSGRLVNVPSDTLQISGLDTPQLVITDEQGRFEIELMIKHPGLYFLKSKNGSWKLLYLNHGFDLHLNSNEHEWMHHLVIDGKGAVENNFLRDKHFLILKIFGDDSRKDHSAKLYGLDPLAFAQKQDTFVAQVKTFFEKGNFNDPLFKRLEPLDWFYHMEYHRWNYYWYHLDNNSLNEVVLPPAIPESTFGTDNEQLYYHSLSYRMVLKYQLRYLLSQKTTDPREYPIKALEMIADYSNPQIRSEMASDWISSLTDTDIAQPQRVYDMLREFVLDLQKRAEIESHFQKRKSLTQL